MCVNFLPAERQQLSTLFGVSPPHADWLPEAWQDYAAPILIDEGRGPAALLAGYGFVPKRHLPPGRRMTTMNARAETIARLPSFRESWQHGRLCLIPMQAFFEPCYESGHAVRTRIGLACGQPFAVAGLWRSWYEDEDTVSHSFTQITVAAAGHPLMSRMHKPGDEKRSLVIIPPSCYTAWLTCRDPATARRWLSLSAATLLQAVPAPLPPRPR